MSACKYRVMDRCKKYNRPCFFSPNCFEPEEEKHMTNADRIRAMSDEELATFMNCDGCPPKNEGCNDGQKCSLCWLEWLQQPAEEE